jgi:diguanylate cyclase (GGDEF)-like protein
VPKLSARLTRQFVALLMLFAASLIFVAGVAVWGLAQTRSSADRLYNDHLKTAQLTADVGQELDDTYETSQSLLLVAPNQRVQVMDELLSNEGPTVDVLLSDLQRTHAGDPPAERALVTALVTSWGTVRRLWTNGSFLLTSSHRVAAEKRLQAAFGPTEGVTDQLQLIERHDASEAHERGDRAYYTSVLLIGGVTGVGLLLGIAFVIVISRRVLPRALAPERDQSDFAEALQFAGGVEEAQELLKRHLERILPDSVAMVLNRDTPADSIYGVTPSAEDSLPQPPLCGVSPRSCLAIRTSREHWSGEGYSSLLRCPACSSCPGTSICTPLTAGGEIIGSVLVSRGEELAVDDHRRIRESVNQAAPVLANLRNLASAELQALTDSLTDLPNKRSVQEALTRLVAIASRSLTPLAALSLDLDHFKEINDKYGHASGDEVLTAVGGVLRTSIRSSDFAGRNGGEEFLILLPSTDGTGAAQLAQKIQIGLRTISVPRVDRPITASIGIAVIPDHAGDARGLEIAADQALYLAKHNGRNRIEIAGDVSPTPAASNA